jgi:type I restriction enzyme S subunit
MIPEGWERYKLGDLCEDISYGYTESASLDKVGPKFLRITDIQDYFTIWDTVPYCPISINNHSKYKLEKGDIVIARTGATTGVTSVFKEENIDAVFASYLIRYRINKRLADPFYIGYILKSSLWKNHINSIIGGSAQPGANAKQFAAFDFILPTLPEQSRIASILSSLDNKIELNLQMNKTLEAIAQAIFKEWFVDFQFPGFDGLLIDGLPKGWRKGKLLELFRLQRGFDLPAISRISGVFPVVAASGISSYHNEFKVHGPGITTGRSGVIGNVYYIIDNFWPLNTSLFIKTFFQSTPLHAYHVLKSINLLNLNGGSAVPTLNRNDVHGLEQTIPSKEVINRYEEISSLLFAKIFQNIKENQTLIQIRDSLLPKLMTGKIKVA